MKTLTAFLMVVVLSVGTMVLLAGCKEKPASPPAEPASSQHDMDTMTHEGQGMEDMMSEEAAKTAEDVKEMATEQTICPVMGNKINKDVFVEYQGKKVYFCCPECKGTFLKDPEKYMGKLPQFQN